MSELSPHEVLLARYLDRMLEGDELRAFEASLANDPHLRAAVDADHRLADSLRGLLGPANSPSDSMSNVTPALSQAPAQSAHRVDWRRISALAAVVVILAGIGIAYNAYRGRTSPFATPPVEPAVVYRTTLDRGFEPAWVCEDDAQMLDFTRERFRRGLLFMPTNGVELVGWGYAGGALSEMTATLLANHGEGRIVLLVDRSRRDRTLEDPSLVDPSLRMFKRVVGRFVLYEITPLDRPLLLDAAYGVDAHVTLKPGEVGPGPNDRSQQ